MELNRNFLYPMLLIMIAWTAADFTAVDPVKVFFCFFDSRKAVVINAKVFLIVFSGAEETVFGVNFMVVVWVV